MISKDPDALTCDLAETYGIFDMKRVPARLLATLAVGLRDTSRIKMSVTKTPVPDNTFLLACIADCLRWIQWSMTKAAQDGGEPPKRLLDYYLGREPEEPEYEVFDSPEDFRAKWAEITRS